MALAPLIIFYAMGYRISSDVSGPPAVGVLLIETTPRRVEVAVDGRDIGRTPKSISSLPPGPITVTLSQKGYHPWRKQVHIAPAEITELTGVRLFASSPTVEPLLQDVTAFSLSANRQLLAARIDNFLYLLDQNGEPISERLTVPFVFQRILWSPDSSNLLLLGSRQVALVNVLSSRFEALPALSGARDIVWDPRTPGRLLFVAPSDNLIAYNLATRRATVLSESVSTFAPSSRNIVTLSQEQTELIVLGLQGQVQRSIPLTAPATALLVSPNGHIAIRYTSGGLGVIPAGEADTLLSITENIKHASFSPNGQLLLVQTDDVSLHVYNIADERLRHVPLRDLQLIVRLSRPVRDAQWFAGGQHLLYQVNDEIVITEIDTRDHPNSVTVDTTNLGQSLAAVGEEGESLYYLKHEAGRTNLVAAALIAQ
ncbi:MAG: hypothetical protein A2854_01655 [Parcubacteria group bacterium RIFCSPHIGHO2_01_FULL_56_18]|nr:MAG: hypothetical protein A2854_01655 [Parcubacteria group bacterium RIFCSPHIGHO2_01_FULL_56_18]